MRKIIQVHATKDNKGNWYVIPNKMLDDFLKDIENEEMIESGEFDRKWKRYATGGHLNLVQLWAEI